MHLTCFPSNSSKWTTIPNKRLEENLPPGMIATMDRLLETHLPYVEQIEHPDLVFKFERDGIHCSFHKTQNLIRSIRFVQGHHPLDYLKLLWTMERDIELEANVTNLEPLHEYNPHTTLVYKAYQAVWPTGPRGEFSFFFNLFFLVVPRLTTYTKKIFGCDRVLFRCTLEINEEGQ